MDEAFDHIQIDRTKKPYKVTIDMEQQGNRPTATGEIDETDSKVHTGFVFFPDVPQTHNFWYHSDEAVIYWDNVKGNTTNIWTGVVKQKGILTDFLYDVG